MEVYAKLITVQFISELLTVLDIYFRLKYLPAMLPVKRMG